MSLCLFVNFCPYPISIFVFSCKPQFISCIFSFIDFFQPTLFLVNMLLILLPIIVSNNSIPFLESVPMFQVANQANYLGLISLSSFVQICEKLVYLTPHPRCTCSTLFKERLSPPFAHHYTRVAMVQWTRHWMNFDEAILLFNSHKLDIIIIIKGLHPTTWFNYMKSYPAILHGLRQSPMLSYINLSHS